MQKIVIFDIETTGLNVATDRIIEIACIKWDGVNNTEKHTFVNPGIPIPPAATEVHGITNEAVEGKPLFRQIAKGIMQFIEGCTIGGYNSNSFDIPLLYAEFARAGITWDYSQQQFIDVCNIFKRKEPRDLSAALKFYCNEDLPEVHSALFDVRATMKVFAQQIERYSLSDMPISELALYCNYDNKRADLSGWFTYDAQGLLVLNKGKAKGTRDKGFIEWLLKLPEVLPDTRALAQQILRK